MNRLGIIGFALVAAMAVASGIVAQENLAKPYRTKSAAGVRMTTLLPPGPDNPRNSEGDFIELKDGRVLLVYTHFTGGGSDHSEAHLAGRVSYDRGLTWATQDELILESTSGLNVMSVSLLRLTNGDIALFYLRKRSLLDCRPVMRLSTDEGDTWSDAIEVITDQVGYYVLNNDRVVQLASGRLICPVALHNLPEYEKPDWHGLLMCYVSDDLGETWRRSHSVLDGGRPDGTRVMLQEPGVIELRDGRLLMWARTDDGSQHVSWSQDQGDTWSHPVASSMISPRSPASMKRLPGRQELLLVWNDHRDVAEELLGNRTPFSLALSRDEGRTWTKSRALEDDPNGFYCYTAIEFVGEHVLLAYCAGDRRTGGLNPMQITCLDLDWVASLHLDQSLE